MNEDTFYLYMMACGYKYLGREQLLSINLQQYLNIICCNNYDGVISKIGGNQSILSVIKTGKLLLDEFFPLLDKTVNYCNKSIALKLFDKSKEMSMDEFLAYQMSFIKRIDSVFVPIDLDNSIDSSFDKVILMLNDNNYLKKVPVIMTNVYLNQRDVNINVSYMHEQTHLLLDRNKGIVDDFLKTEVLSIFMEKVSALRLDSSEKLLANVELMRQVHTKFILASLGKYNVDLILSYELKKYIISAALADIMFNQYYSLSNIDRKCYLEEVEKILSNKKVLDDFLDEQNISVYSKQLPMIVDDMYHKSLVKTR